MRRKDREIFGAQIEEILLKGEYGVLASVCPDGTPYAVPMSYAWKDGLLHLHCALRGGQKLENLAHQAAVSFVVVGDTQVQPDQFCTRYESVVVNGQMAPAQDPQASLMALVEKYCADHLQEGRAYARALGPRTGVYVITPTSITGKAKRDDPTANGPHC